MSTPLESRTPPGRAGAIFRLMLRFLPAAILIPLVLGWLRVEGERAGLYGPVVGTAMFATATITLISLLVWFNARTEVRSLEALRRGEQRTRLIIDSAYDAFIAMDVDGRIIDWNPQAEKTFGYSRNEALGRILAEIIIPERYRERHRLGLARFMSTGEGPVLNKRLEISALCRDGREIPVELTISPVRWSGTWIFNAFVHDITDRKEKDELAATSAAKDHFIAVLSHELRTPLTPVLATIMDLESQLDLPPKTREAIQLIQRNVELEARLIDDLLDVTRISKGRLQVNREVVPLHALLRAALDICHSEILKKCVRVDLDLQAPQNHIEGDSPRLLQVFWNLLQNAVKFTPPGGEIAVRTRAENAGMVGVEITDSGIGISAEALPRIFDPFEQADSSISRRYGGLGLGLALSKALVEAHGGTIAVSSPGMDRGTTIRLAFAIAERSPRDTKIPDHHAEVAPNAPRALCILLVEDHEDTRRTLANLLERWGHSVASADTVAAGLELASEQPFDLLISDLGLPDAHGTDLILQLRKTSDIPGIAISGFGSEGDTARSLAAGFAFHLTKPIGTQKLKETIDQIVQSQDRSGNI